MSSSGSIGSRFEADQARRKRTRRIVVIVAVITAIFVVSGVSLSFARRAPGPESQYRTAEVKRSSFTAVVSADGSVEPEDSRSVYPTVSGIVKRVDVEQGDRVTAGDVLYVVSNGDLKTRTAEAKASVDGREQQMVQAQQALDAAYQAQAEAEVGLLRARQGLEAAPSLPASSSARADRVSLAKKQVGAARRAVSTADASVRSARAAVAAGQSGLSAAEDAYDAAKADQKSVSVKSPIDGQVLEVSVAEGQPVSDVAGPGVDGSSSASVVVADVGALKARVAVGENDRARVRVGQKVAVTFDALNATVEGTVRWISPVATDTRGVVQYPVDIELESKPAGLAPGMSVSAEITTGTWTDAIAVPNSAVKTDGARAYVVVLREDGSTEEVAVQTGLRSSGLTRVLKGLSEGDTVVLGAADRESGSGSSVPNPLNPGASF